MSRKILGLDIRHNAVSAVLVNSSIKGNAIEAHEYIPISDQKDIKNNLVASLETILEKIDISGSVCVASFPADQISYRNIQVPFKGQKKIKKILPYELEPTLPLPLDGLIIDFYTVKPPVSSDYTHLIAAAVEKSKLQSYLETLADFDIEPQIVTVGGYPAALCLTNLADVRKNWLFIDLENNKSTVFAILSGAIYLIRSFPISLDARSSKIRSLCINIQRTLSAFEEIIGLDFQPDGAYITGCGLDDLGFDNDMTQILGFPVKRMDLIRAKEIAKHDAPSHSWIPLLMDNAFSLALMEIEGVDGLNFREGPIAAKKFWEENKKGLIKTGAIFVLVLVLAFFNVVLDSYFMGKKLTGLNNKMTDIFTSTFPDVKKIVDPFQQMRIKIEEAKKNALLPGATDKHIRAIDILNNISKLIPKETDVNLTRLVIGIENVQIVGDTDTFNSVDDMKSRLEQVKFFKKITITSANIDRSDNRVRFKLKVQL